MDSVIAPAWIVYTTILCLTALKIAKRCFPDDCGVALAMHVSVLMWSWLGVSCFILSPLGAIQCGTVALTVAGLALASLLCIPARTARDDSRKGEVGDLKTPRYIQVIWCLTGVVIIYHNARNGLARFPTEWDTLMYHRPLITLWAQTGSLFVPQCAVWHFPGNNELLGLWWALPFSGDFLVPLMNLSAVFLLAAGINHFATLAGLTRTVATAVTLVILANSVVFLQCVDAKNDVTVCALFFTTLFYGVRYAHRKFTANLIFCGLSAGLLAGVKYYALGYVAIGAVGLCLTAGWLRGAGFAVRALATAFPLLLANAGYWYFRNWFHTGTPVFPIGYSGEFYPEVASRLDRNLWSTSLLGNGRIELFPQYLSAVREMCSFRGWMAVSFLPLTCCWLFARVVLPANSEGLSGSRRAIRLGLCAMTVSSWLYFLATPCTVDMYDEFSIHSSLLVVRFSQIPLALSLILLAMFVSDVCGLHVDNPTRRSLRLISILILVDASGAFLLRAFGILNGDATTGIITSLNVLLIGGFVLHWLRTLQGLTCRIVCSLCIVVSFVCVGLVTNIQSRWWHDGFAEHYDALFRTSAYTSLERNPSENTILVLQYRYYPFFGSRRQNRVYRPLRHMSPEFILAYLGVTNSDRLVVVDRGNRSELRSAKGMETWIEVHPDVFEIEFSGSHFDTYVVNHRELETHLVENPWAGIIPENSLFQKYRNGSLRD